MSDRDDTPSRREAELERELGESKLATQVVEIRAELKAMREALRLTQAFPTALDKEIGRVVERNDQQHAALKELLAEQRAASKEASAKAEESLTEQLRLLGITYEGRHENTRTLFHSLKERMTLLEGKRTGASDSLGWIVGTTGIAVGVIGVVIAILTYLALVPKS